MSPLMGRHYSITFGGTPSKIFDRLICRGGDCFLAKCPSFRLVKSRLDIRHRQLRSAYHRLFTDRLHIGFPIGVGKSDWPTVKTCQSSNVLFLPFFSRKLGHLENQVPSNRWFGLAVWWSRLSGVSHPSSRTKSKHQSEPGNLPKGGVSLVSPKRGALERHQMTFGFTFGRLFW